MLFSEPKIPHEGSEVGSVRFEDGFSALQRAENSSPKEAPTMETYRVCFSALQRAENSSPGAGRDDRVGEGVSVLFSEPKIPHST